MLFNSLAFAIFFPVVTALYFLLPHAWRWMLILSASCAFYMAFIPAYILILGATILIDYLAGLGIEKAGGPARKRVLIISLAANIGILFVFKYFNFFNANLSDLAAFLHWNYPIRGLELILPIGLSFHTFQSMAYTIEVYYGRQKAERHLGIFASFVMFYPQLVAGPIERPQALLPQFREVHRFDAEMAVNGLRLMLWGFFKKCVIADGVAPVVNTVYENPQAHPGFPLLLATVLFAFQIYCDFSGYSDIARGSARVMGFRLMRNFAHPYGSGSVGEFWKRWHISLSFWFRDYLYIPMGGNRVSRGRHYANLMATFLVSGLWHGANWTFLVWGGLHGGYLVIADATRSLRRAAASFLGLDRFPRMEHALSVATTFSLVAFAWIFFRAENLADATFIARNLFTGMGDLLLLAGEPARLMATLSGYGLDLSRLLAPLAAILLMLAVESSPPPGGHLTWLDAKPRWLRWPLYYGIVMGILLFGEFTHQQFIYFQF